MGSAKRRWKVCPEALRDKVEAGREVTWCVCGGLVRFVARATRMAQTRLAPSAGNNPSREYGGFVLDLAVGAFTAPAEAPARRWRGKPKNNFAGNLKKLGIRSPVVPCPLPLRRLLIPGLKQPNLICKNALRLSMATQSASILNQRLSHSCSAILTRTASHPIRHGASLEKLQQEHSTRNFRSCGKS